MRINRLNSLAELPDYQSDHAAGMDLPTYLRQQGIVSIDAVDTRLLTGKLRTGGALKVLMTTDPEPTDEALIQQVKAAEGLDGRDLVLEVCRKKAGDWTQGYVPQEFSPLSVSKRAVLKKAAREAAVLIVVIDCGIKRSILRSLVEVGFKVHVVPAHMSADDILATKPEGIFISNG
ncbi:MAG: hypothetical protein IH891_09515, partial [Planctomycetes bacterium]|nr:hypothetical protein [Planctomycetota bacterium]